MGTPGTPDPSAVAPLTGVISFDLFYRFSFSDNPATIVKIGDAIKVSQTKMFEAKIELKFTSKTGQVQTGVATLNLDRSDRRKNRYIKRSNRRRSKKINYMRRVAFFYNPLENKIGFFVGRRAHPVKLGVTLANNLQLVTRGEVFLKDSPFGCLALSTTLPKLKKKNTAWPRRYSKCIAHGKLPN